MRLQALFACLALSTVACSTPVGTGYLDRQAALEPGRFMDGVWCSDRLVQTPSYAGVRIVSVKARGIESHRGVSASRAVSWFKSAIRKDSAKGKGGKPILVFSERGLVGNLEVAITEMTPGSVTARAWAAEFGAGHAYVQVEAKLTDAATGRLLCEMVQRTRSSGALGYRDLVGDGDAGPDMVRQMLGMVARALRNELRAKLQGVPVN